MQVAIDGPASAGKSTVSKIVAEKLSFIYIDTGAMYRAITLVALDQNVALTDEQKITELAADTEIDFKLVEGVQRIYINHEDRTDAIRTPEVAANVSAVSAIAGVREHMVALQRKLAGQHDVVMDGRDIGTTVLPDAKVKIFLTASVESRAKRRLLDFEAKGIKLDLQQIEQDIAERDYKDSHRAISPLQKARDAVEIDTTNLSISESVEAIMTLVKKNQEKNS